MIRFNEITENFDKKTLTILGLTGVVNLCIGGAVGYILARKFPRGEEVEEVQLEIDYAVTKANINEIMAESFERFRRAQEAHTIEMIEAFKAVVMSVPISIHKFETEEEIYDEWVQEEEERSRTREKPYVISVEEFARSETGFKQQTLTYYKGDNVLCDDSEPPNPIYDHPKVVGDLKFGHGSKDISICYIRNEVLEGEYEIILEHGYYQIDVLGQEIEDQLMNGDVKHSVRKFKE